jgi:hypothetical protein
MSQERKKESQENINKWVKKWNEKIHGPARGQSNNWRKEYYNTHAKLLSDRNPLYYIKSSEPAAAASPKAKSGPLTREEAIEIAMKPGAFFRKMKSNAKLSHAKKAHPVRKGGRRTRRHTKRRHTLKN